MIRTTKGVDKSQARKEIVEGSVFWAARITTAAAKTTPTISPQNKPVPTKTRSRVAIGAVLSLVVSASTTDNRAVSSVLFISFLATNRTKADVLLS